MFYNATTKKYDITSMMQDVYVKLSGLLATEGFKAEDGYSVNLVACDDTIPSLSIAITHLGYTVPILYYRGQDIKPGLDGRPDIKFESIYKYELQKVFGNTTLTQVQMLTEIENAISRVNQQAAELLYDQIKTHKVLKDFEKIVMVENVSTKNFPSPEEMFSKFEQYYNNCTAQSKLPFPTTIGDFFEHIKATIMKNTAFWVGSINRDSAVMNKYEIKCAAYIDPSIFSVYHDLESMYGFDITAATCLGTVDDTTGEYAKSPIELSIEETNRTYTSELMGICGNTACIPVVRRTA